MADAPEVTLKPQAIEVKQPAPDPNAPVIDAYHTPETQKIADKEAAKIAKQKDVPYSYTSKTGQEVEQVEAPEGVVTEDGNLYKVGDKTFTSKREAEVIAETTWAVANA